MNPTSNPTTYQDVLSKYLVTHSTEGNIHSRVLSVYKKAESILYALFLVGAAGTLPAIFGIVFSQNLASISATAVSGSLCMSSFAFLGLVEGGAYLYKNKKRTPEQLEAFEEGIQRAGYERFHWPRQLKDVTA